MAYSHKAGSIPPTSDPIPIEQDEDEMLSSHIKSVSVFIFKSVERESCRDDVQTRSTRNKHNIDDSEFRSSSRTMQWEVRVFYMRLVS
jgi:hypothetical protein